MLIVWQSLTVPPQRVHHVPDVLQCVPTRNSRVEDLVLCVRSVGRGGSVETPCL